MRWFHSVFSGIIQLQGREQQNRQTGNNKIRVATERKAQRGRKEIKMKNYIINYEEEKIEVSNTFYNKASKYGTPEYRELRAIRESEPTFKVEIKKPKQKGTKTTYRGLTREAMKAHIKMFVTDTTKAEAELKKLEEMFKYGDARGSSGYPVAKHWFIENYGKSFISASKKERANKNDENCNKTVIENEEIHENEENAARIA